MKTSGNSKFGWRELLLATVSTLSTAIMADLVLGLSLTPSYIAETKYGWKAPENVVWKNSIEDTSGQFRIITVRHFQHGFKRWGDPKSPKPKILVIGDSVTEATQVSNGEEWYSYLEQRFNDIELFVYGSGGYGSLQEYLILEDYIERINPQVLLWQFCTNDYANNLYEFDLSGYPYNNHAVRPYLEDDKIVYKLPLPYAGVRQYSFFADRLLKEYDTYVFHRATRDLAAYIRRRKEHETDESIRAKQNLHAKAYKVTLDIMKKVRLKAKDVLIYSVNLCSGSSEDEQKLFSEAGIMYLPGIVEYVNSSRHGHAVLIPNDGHWNRLGNQLAGERLVKSFEELNIVNESLARNLPADH